MRAAAGDSIKPIRWVMVRNGKLGQIDERDYFSNFKLGNFKLGKG
jgi:hypothetical protein